MNLSQYFMNVYFLPVLAGVLVALGQFLLKKALGTIPVEISSFRLLTLFIFRAVTNAMVLSAILLMISGTVTYFISLRFLVLTRAVPITASVVLASSILLGWLFLNEDLSFYQMIGISLILGGVGVIILFCR